MTRPGTRVALEPPQGPTMTDRPKREAAIAACRGAANNRDLYPNFVDRFLEAVDEHLGPALARKAGGLEVTALADRVDTLYGRTGHHRTRIETLEARLGDVEGRAEADAIAWQKQAEKLASLERICIDPELGLRGRVKLLSGARDRLDDVTDRLSDEAEADRERLRKAIERIEKLEADYGTNGYETEEDQPCGSLGSSGGVASGDITRSKTDCPCGIPTTTAATAGDSSADSPTPEPQAEERFGGLTLAGLTGTWDGLWDLARAYERDHAALRTEKADHQQTKDLLNAEMESRAAYDAEIIAATKVEIDQVRAAAEASLAAERQRREQEQAAYLRSSNIFIAEAEVARNVIAGQEAERDSLKARVAELETALRPFAEHRENADSWTAAQRVLDAQKEGE